MQPRSTYITMIFRLASGEPSGRQRQIAVIIFGTWFDRAEQWLTCLRMLLSILRCLCCQNRVSDLWPIYGWGRGEYSHRLKIERIPTVPARWVFLKYNISM